IKLFFATDHHLYTPDFQDFISCSGFYRLYKHERRLSSSVTTRYTLYDVRGLYIPISLLLLRLLCVMRRNILHNHSYPFPPDSNPAPRADLRTIPSNEETLLSVSCSISLRLLQFFSLTSLP